MFVVKPVLIVKNGLLSVKKIQYMDTTKTFDCIFIITPLSLLVKKNIIHEKLTLQ